MEEKKRIKVYFTLTDIRKFTIKKSMTYKEIFNLLKTKNTTLNEKSSLLKYEDEDKDWIIFKTEEEWKEALDFHPDWTQPLKIKIFQINKSKKVKHTGVICDSCQLVIFGTRYNCTQCLDYDLCDSCYFNNAGGHMHQKFDKFEKPLSRSQYQNILKARGKLTKKPAEKPAPHVEEKEMKKILEVVHEEIMCDECHKASFKGPRYQCIQCQEYDLCMDCYLKHKNLHFGGKHKFDCFINPVDEQEEVDINKQREIESWGQKKKMKMFKNITHDDIKCNHCTRVNFKGLRYRCLDCIEYDVCTKCYVPNLHFNGTHKFHVFKTSLTELDEDKVLKRERKKYETYKKARALVLKIEAKRDQMKGSSSKIVVKPKMPVQAKVVVHNDIQCNECKEISFTGTRYRCLVCSEHDVCAKCYKTVPHYSGGHKFIEFKKEVSEDEEEKLIKSEKKKYLKKTPKKVIHHNIRCNGCSMIDFEGIRLQCLDCDDFDVCEKCYKPVSHFEGRHKFIEFKKEVSEEEEVKIRKWEKDIYDQQKKISKEKQEKEEKEQLEKQKQKLEKERKEKKVVHTGLQCNDCKEVDFEGVRFQCVVCDDYDICTKCYKPLSHFEGKHKFIKFRKEVTEEEESAIRKKEKEIYAKEQKQEISVKDFHGNEDKYKIHVKTLSLLGYTNTELNLFLLGKHAGNVPKVIAELKLLN